MTTPPLTSSPVRTSHAGRVRQVNSPSVLEATLPAACAQLRDEPSATSTGKNRSGMAAPACGIESHTGPDRRIQAQGGIWNQS